MTWDLFQPRFVDLGLHCIRIPILALFREVFRLFEGHVFVGVVFSNVFWKLLRITELLQLT
jgi:hypothetical protein